MRVLLDPSVQLIQQNVLPHATVVALTGDDYVTLLTELARAGVAGGAVYDAVIARAAELGSVDQLLTLNIAHFQQVWIGGSGRIASPQTVFPP